MSQIVIALKDGDPKEIAKSVEREVNCFNILYEKIIKGILEDTDLDCLFMEISIRWIRAGEKDFISGKNYDGRNEYSCHICVMLANAYFIKQQEIAAPIEITDLAKKTVNAMERMHRTSKQSFSGLVFRYLKSKAEGDSNLKVVVDAMDQNLGAGWERCPMI